MNLPQHDESPIVFVAHRFAPTRFGAKNVGPLNRAYGEALFGSGSAAGGLPNKPLFLALLESKTQYFSEPLLFRLKRTTFRQNARLPRPEKKAEFWPADVDKRKNKANIVARSKPSSNEFAWPEDFFGGRKTRLAYVL
jgi:hypothetical protein